MPTPVAASAPPDPAPDPELERLPSWLTRLGDAILTTDSRQRRTLSLLLLAALVTATVVGLLAYATMIGVAQANMSPSDSMSILCLRANQTPTSVTPRRPP